jgi:hypothetical protein
MKLQISYSYSHESIIWGSDFELVVAKGVGSRLQKSTMPVQTVHLIVNYINIVSPCH